MYFIRHGNAHYMKDCLTETGRKRVDALVTLLDNSLPDSLDGVLVASGARRTTQSADRFVPMLSRKTGSNVIIQTEPALYMTRSMGSDDQILENGRENVPFIYRYQADYGFFVSHDNIIVATSIAIAEDKGIKIPVFLQVEKEVTDELVANAVAEYEISPEAARDILKKHMEFMKRIPPIAEASAIHIDLVQRNIEYIIAEDV